MRRCAELLIFAAISVMALRGFMAQGLLVPVRVVGPSMAVTLLGPHVRVTCEDCGYTFDCDGLRLPESQLATCPNCDYRDNPLKDLEVRPGDRMWIDRSAYAARSLRRWEVVVFRCREQAGQYCVKRVVGLPGEEVRTCRGDVYIDGSLARKSLEQFREMAIPVFDSRYRPVKSDLPPRWQATREPSSWISSGDGFRYGADTDTAADTELDAAATDWLWYRHWRRSSSDANQSVPARLTDAVAYNQAVSRQLSYIADLLLVARIRATGLGELSFLVRSGHREMTLRISPATGAGTLYVDSTWVARFDAPPWQDRQVRVEVGTVDGSFLVGIDGHEVLSHVFEGPSKSGDVSASDACSDQQDVVGEDAISPIAVGAHNLDIKIENLQLLRDVYYTDVFGAEATTLGPNEFFILGDNSPVSEDSRRGAILDARHLLGKPSFGT